MKVEVSKRAALFGVGDDRMMRSLPPEFKPDVTPVTLGRLEWLGCEKVPTLDAFTRIRRMEPLALSTRAKSYDDSRGV